MRCIAGLVLFVVLYFGGCMVLAGIAGELKVGNGSRNSGLFNRVAEASIVKKYHALMAVGAGAASLAICCLPTLLASTKGNDEWYG